MEGRQEPAEISGIRYDEDRRRLVVRFEGGDEIAYVGVPGEVHRAFADALSKPQFLDREIDGRYPFNKLT